VEKKEIKLDHNTSTEIKRDEKKNEQKNETVGKIDPEKDNKNKQEKQSKKKKVKKEKKKKVFQPCVSYLTSHSPYQSSS